MSTGAPARLPPPRPRPRQLCFMAAAPPFRSTLEAMKAQNFMRTVLLGAIVGFGPGEENSA
eukprot:2579009-Alexandrium_andersonii.AAC.1